MDREADFLPSLPSAIIALPSTENVSFSPAPTNPLKEFQPGPATGPEKIHNWNPGGADLLDIAVPFGFFLAPRDEAAKIQSHTENNALRVRSHPCALIRVHAPHLISDAPQHHLIVPCLFVCPTVHAHVAPQLVPRAMQGSNGAEYGGSVKLETQIDLESNSTECVPAGTCAPMGGYSVWASMPPHSNSTAAGRKQVLVLSHWDSQGLFRSIISVRISSASGPACLYTACFKLAASYQHSSAAGRVLLLAC